MTKTVVPEKTVPSNSKATLIKAVIIAGTFLAIIALSIITRGPNGASPSTGVIAARILLLLGCSVVYFGMLYYTKASRRNDKQKPRAGKKKA